jgi:hypothetical protein
MADNVYDYADEILKVTDPEIPRELDNFINEAADYEEPQFEKMKRFARRDLEARRGNFIASPYLRTSSVKIGTPLASLYARMTGDEEAADSVQRLGRAYTEAQREQTAESTYPGLPDPVARTALDVGTEITAQAPHIALAAMSGGGVPAIVAQQSLYSADRSYTEALDAGKSQQSAAQHAIGMGVVEGGVTALFSLVGLGGFEKFAAGAKKPMVAGVKQAVKNLGIQTLSELGEETAIHFGQSMISFMDGVDPEAMTWDSWKRASKDIFLQTVATMGLYSAPGALASRSAKKVQSTEDKILSLADKRKVTRKDWTGLGFSRLTGETDAERLDTVNHIADQIRQRRESDEAAVTEDGAQVEGAVTPEGAPTPVEGAPVEPAVTPEGAPVDPTAVEPVADPTTQQDVLTEPEAAIQPEGAPPVEQDAGSTPLEAATEGEPGMSDTAAVETLEPVNPETAVEEATGDTTGIYDEIAAEIRRGVELPGLEGETAQSQEMWNDAAAKKMKDDSHWIHTVMEDINNKSRNLSPIEIAGLNRHMRELGNELDIQARRAESDDLAVQADALELSEVLVMEIDELTQVAKRAGTEWGRSGVARQIELREDFSLKRMLHAERTLKRDKLTRDEIVEVTALSKEITVLQDKLAKEQEAHQKLQDDLRMEGAIASAKKRRKPSRKAAAKAKRRQAVAQFSNALSNLELHGGASVKAFLAGEGGSAVIPVEVIAAAKDVVVAVVQEGVATFSEFWAEAHADVDTFDGAEQAFKEAWEDVRSSGLIEQTGISPDQTQEVAKYADRMLRAVVASGKTNKDVVLAEVHEELAKVVPDINRRQVLDAITKQGRYTVPTKAKTEAAKNIAEVRKQLALQRRLNELQSGRIAKKEKKTPAEVSQEIKDLKAQIKEAQEKSPVLQYRKQRDTERRLRNQLLDVIDRKKKEKAPSRELEEEEARLKKEIVLARKVDDLQQRLEAVERGEVPAGRKKRTPSEEAEEIRSLKEQIARAEDASPAIKKAREESKKETYRKQLESRLEEYERQIDEDDVMPKQKGIAPSNKRIRDLQYEIEVAKSKVHVRRAKLMRQNMENHEKAWEIIKGTLNTARTLRTSMDLSAVLRQGGFLAFSHPILSARAIPKMLKAAMSEKGAFQLEQEIENRDNAQLYKRDGLSLTKDAGPFKDQEEAFAGHYLDTLAKIPGLKHPIGVVKGSQRAYTAYLNQVRADAYDLMTATMSKSGKVTEAEGAAIAQFINIATGRGSLGKAEPAAETLATVFFAPKYVASRFQLILSEPFKAATGIGHSSARTRKMVAAEYGRAVGGVIAFYTMIQMLSLAYDDDDPKKPRVGYDPRSSDLGKVVIGNTRLDPLAGLSQTAVLLTRNTWGEKVSAGGKEYDLTREEGEKVSPMSDDIYDVNSRFQRSKLSPWLSSAIDARTGENLVGEQVTPATVAMDMITPLVFSDIYDTMQEQGYAKGTILSTLAIFGMGLQTYDPKSNQKGVVPNPFAVTE